MLERRASKLIRVYSHQVHVQDCRRSNTDTKGPRRRPRETPNRATSASRVRIVNRRRSRVDDGRFSFGHAQREIYSRRSSR